MAKFINYPTGQQALTFDDVLLQPGYSEILPTKVNVTTNLTNNISLNIPIISSAMDTVTEAPMAIAMAQAGGIGVIHRNLEPEQQAEQIRQVKRFESGMVVNPLTIGPEAKLADALSLMHANKISGIPVVENGGKGGYNSGKLIGILTNRDVRFAQNPAQKIKELMTCKNLVTIRNNINQESAKRLLHLNRIEKLLVVDNDGNCTGLITVKDIERSNQYPNATKDGYGQLMVAAACGVGKEGMQRVEQLIDAGVDVIVIDTAHGHSKLVLQSLEMIKKTYSKVSVIAGNVATSDGTKALIDAGADSVKIGIGPGSICTTRIISGVGIPQLSAIMAALEIAKKMNIPIIADGGIKYSGDIAKAIAAGAGSVMIGSLLAGTDESPGKVYLHKGRSYKSYRGMGSIDAMARGSADRYFQAEINDNLKLVPEGVEGQVPYKGSVQAVLHQIVGGLRAAMGYVGGDSLVDFQNKAVFVKISKSSLSESHVHDVTITRETPNYHHTN